MKKPSVGVLGSKQQKLEFLRKRGTQARAIAPLARHTAWKAVQELISEHLDDCNSELDGHIDLPDKKVTALLEKKKNLEFFYGMPEACQNTLEKIREEEIEIRKEINEYSRKLKQ